MKFALFLAVLVAGVVVSTAYSEKEYKLRAAFCKLIKGKHVYHMYNLNRSCTSKVRQFERAICVVKPTDNDSPIELSCIDIQDIEFKMKKWTAR